MRGRAATASAAAAAHTAEGADRKATAGAYPLTNSDRAMTTELLPVADFAIEAAKGASMEAARPAGSRSTQQYRLVAELMRDNMEHPSADEVYMLAREQAPNISRDTVYRNLNRLADEGRITRLTMPTGPDHFDSVTERHTHFLCRSCNRVFDTPVAYDDALDGAVKGMPGFEAEWHRLILVGNCPECREKQQEATGTSI